MASAVTEHLVLPSQQGAAASRDLLPDALGRFVDCESGASGSDLSFLIL